MNTGLYRRCYKIHFCRLDFLLFYYVVIKYWTHSNFSQFRILCACGSSFNTTYKLPSVNMAQFQLVKHQKASKQSSMILGSQQIKPNKETSNDISYKKKKKGRKKERNDDKMEPERKKERKNERTKKKKIK